MSEILDRLRYTAASTGTGTLTVTIEELSAVHYAHDAALRRAKAEGLKEGEEYALNEAAMRAGCAAHRACCGIEADNSQGKIHGCCVVCGVPWPCETAQFFLFKAYARAAQIEEGSDVARSL